MPVILQQHDEYVQKLVNTGNVVLRASFGERDGGLLIMKGSLQKEVAEGDPADKQGLLELEIKELYIAQGAFCEQ